MTGNLELFSQSIAKFYDRSTFQVTQLDEVTKLEIEKLPDLSEGKTLIEFCEHQEEVCRAAIACGIERVQLVCGKVEYSPIAPKTFLPLLTFYYKKLAEEREANSED